MLYLLFQHLCPANPEFAVATATVIVVPDLKLTSVDDVDYSLGMCWFVYAITRTWTATDTVEIPRQRLKRLM
jgi:hypothetical protein